MRKARLAASTAVAPLSIPVVLLVALAVFGMIGWSVVVAVTIAVVVLGLLAVWRAEHRARGSDRSGDGADQRNDGDRTRHHRG